MTSYPPPTANLEHFNPLVFSVSETPLTLEEASKLYAKKSGAIFYGPIAAPSLSLNGVGVGTKLNEIDTNSAKLTDVIYNNNTTSISNDFSVDGILKLQNLPNAGDTIEKNKQKTTKISYDEDHSVTIIGDTLKASGTLIVGSNNYNASDQFEKLQNISKSGNTLTIDDSIFLTGNLRLPDFVDVNGQMLIYEKRLTDITFDDVSLITEIDNSFEVAGNFKLNTIADVEQKIIDISNAVIPYITYVGDELVVTKNMDLGTNDLSCNFMRPLGLGTYGMKYGLSQDWTDSYLLFQNGGHYIDAMNPDGTGRALSLNFFSQADIFLGSTLGSTTHVNGKLNVSEKFGTLPSATGGSLTLIHYNSGGTSSIVFKSQEDSGSDYGYISYKDDYLNGVDQQRSLLEIGVQNDGVGTNVDNIALMPSGFVGVNTRTPQVMLDVNGDTQISGNLQLGSILDVEDAINNAGGVPSITYDAVTSTTTIADILKASGTLIVGSQNYDAGDEFEKLQNISRVATTLTITDSINLTGNLQLNTITDVEQKIIDISNAVIPYITYDTVNEKLVVTKDMDLGINDLSCNFMRPIGTESYGLSKNWAESYLSFQNGGHHLDAMFANGTGRDLFLNFYAQSDIQLGSWTNNSTTHVNGNLNIRETNGTIPSAVGGSLTLEHDDVGGTSSIVFKSKANQGSDHGYISYIDDISGDSGEERSLLEIGVNNDVPSIYIDNIALMPSGYVGINTRTPQTMLDVSGDIDCNEIKVNKIPLNAFYNFTYGYDYTPTLPVGIGFGRGYHIQLDVSTFNHAYSHFETFRRDEDDIHSFRCESNYLGTYEITAHVIYRNNQGGRHNPCIAIGVNDDVCDGTVGATNTGPKWDVGLTTGYCQHNIFSAQYVRHLEGKVTNLSCSRIYHFTNTTDLISINTFIEGGGGDLFEEIAVSSGYKIINAGISFKYIGNFDNITFYPF